MASMATFGLAKLQKHSTRYFITPRNPVGLTDLPLDLKIDILSLLEWDDVLRARETCRSLRDTSLTRPVWLALFKWYSATVSPQPFWLEKPLDLYKDRELEYLVLRWQKIKVCSTISQYQELPLQRYFIAPKHERNSVYLVEGGRWLLVGTNSGSVLCYDLNATAVVPVLLIPSPFGDTDERIEILLSVDKNPGSEYPKFNLGIITRCVPSTDPDSIQPPHLFRWIQIWQITANVDKTDGKPKGLRAEQLACFPEECRSYCKSFRLRGRYVAYALNNSYEPDYLRDESYIIIVDWTLCNSASLVYTRKVIWEAHAAWLALLPGNMLLCFFFKNFLLFDLNDAPVTTLDPSHYPQHITKIRPVAGLSLFADAISQPYFLHNSTRISVITSHGVKGVIIAHSNGTSPVSIQQVELVRHDFHSRYSHIGYDHALICCWPVLLILQYAWPEDRPRALVSSHIIKDPHRARGLWPAIHFDEYSGRIIISVEGISKYLQCLLGMGP